MASPRKGKRGKARTAPRPFPTKLVLKILGWGALLSGVIVGVRQLEAHALATLPVHDTRVEWVDLPVWLEQDEAWRTRVLTEIEQGRHMEQPEPLVVPLTDINHPKVTPWVYAVVANSPWVEHVERVVKLRDGRVRIHATFREPHAVVEHLGRAHLVDASGVRLPESWEQEFISDGIPWLRIIGSRARLPGTGERFVGADVQAGLKLAAFLYHQAEQGQAEFIDELESIDVSEYDEKIGGLRIFPRENGSNKERRSYIYWGHVPGEGYGVEASAERKVEALQNLREHWGTISGAWPYRVSHAPEITFISDGS